MRKNILAAIILAVLLAAVPSDAAVMRTRLTLTITSAPQPPSHEVSADFLDGRGIFTGSRTETRTFTDSHGRSVTETETEYRNIHGELLMSADVAITARSDDFTVRSGETFAETFSVDVTLSLNDRGYDEYRYTLGIAGLPAWLNASGELLSSDTLTTGTTRHHHEFRLSGTTGAFSGVAVLGITAVVHVSGDVPIMRATGSKDVTISAEIVPKPPDVVPKPPEYVDIGDNEPPGSGGGTISLADILRNMTPEQKAAVKSLKVGSNVRDLTGLEEFTNLERLDLREALSLETVDLNGNSAVKSVDVSGNPAMKTLTLTGSNVEHVDASGCESLSEVNISGCETLRTLNVSNTPITRLDAEDCTGLEVLDCSDCRLEELRLSGCVSLNVLDCHNNSLHMLDAYTFRLLTELTCNNQQITGWNIGRVFSFRDKFAELFTAAEYTGAENVTNLKAWNIDGMEISAEYDRDTGTARFSDDPVKMTYDYITGFGDAMMDVAVFSDEVLSLGSAGGCGAQNAGLMLWACVMAMALLMFRKRR